MNESTIDSRVELGIHRSRVSRRRWRKRTRCLVIKLGYSVTGGHKYRDMVLQVAGWTQVWQPCSVNKSLFRNPNWRADAIWQNFLRESTAQKGPFCQWWWWWWWWSVLEKDTVITFPSSECVILFCEETTNGKFTGKNTRISEALQNQIQDVILPGYRYTKLPCWCGHIVSFPELL
jgi:hypothetical protein